MPCGALWTVAQGAAHPIFGYQRSYLYSDPMARKIATSRQGATTFFSIVPLLSPDASASAVLSFTVEPAKGNSSVTTDAFSAVSASSVTVKVKLPPASAAAVSNAAVAVARSRFARAVWDAAASLEGIVTAKVRSRDA